MSPVVDFREAQQAANRILDACVAEQAKTIERLTQDREFIAAVLQTFYDSPLSMSSVGPVLALAELLNPGLHDSARCGGVYPRNDAGLDYAGTCGRGRADSSALQNEVS